MASKKHVTPEQQAFMNGHRLGAPRSEESEQDPSAFDAGKALKLLLDNPRIHRALHRQGADEEIDDTKHGFYDVLLAEVALLAHWSESDIVALIAQANVNGGRPKPNTEYCKIVIREAQLKTKTGNLDFAREALLMNLSDTWKLEIHAVIRHGTENALWHLRLEDGTEIQLGNSQDLMSQTKVRGKIFDVTGHMIPRYSPKQAHLWDHHLSILALAAVTVDTPEMTRKGQAIAYVNGYLEKCGCEPDTNTSEEEWEQLAQDNAPFVRQGMVFLSARNLCFYVRTLDPKMTERELLDLLRLLGGRRSTINIEVEKKTSRSLWRIPPHQLREIESRTEPLKPLSNTKMKESISD